MKHIAFIFAMLIAMTTNAQSKKNGTIYSEHPAINAVENMVKAFVAGDSDKVSSFLADDFKAFSGTNTNPDAKGSTKEQFLNGVTFWKENMSYFSIERQSGSYPDALEYTDENQQNIIWVQTWEHMKAVHNETGVKIDMAMFRMFIVNSENKITRLFGYLDGSEFDEIGQSFSTRTNGTLYKNHENINKARRVVRAFEHKDFETAYSFFDENATFRSVHMPPGESQTLEESKAATLGMFDKYDLDGVDQVGYPDYLHYEQGDSRVVQSWWNFRITRKADGKKIKLPIMYLHDFNEDGKITRSSVYFSLSMLQN